MALTTVTSQVGGTGRTSNPDGSIIFTSAPDLFSNLTAVAGDDQKMIRLDWNAGNPAFVFANPSVSDITGKMIWSGDLSPAQITANQNDYNPTSLSTSAILRLNTDASRNITGLAGGADGRVIVAFNIGANNIVLQNQNASSTAANRFIHPSSVDQTLLPEESVSYWYDSTTARWRPFAYHFGKLAVARGGTNSTTALSSDRMMISSSGAIVESNILRPGTGAAGELRFYEDPAGGTNYVALKAGSLTANTTWTLPTADGTNGQALTTNGSAILAWTTISGGTSPFTSTSGIIDYATATDRLRLKVGEVGDIGLEVTGIASQTSNFIDVKTLVADTQPIFAVNSAGRIRFGSGGSTAVDTSLYRSAANTLTMDHVIIAGTATAGGASILTLSPGAHTAQTAENTDLLVNAHTNTITGAITTQRFNWFRQPTITAATALTVTTAASLVIEGAPIAAGSATITNPYSLWIQGGRTRLDGLVSIGSLESHSNVALAVSAAASPAVGSITLRLRPADYTAVPSEMHDFQILAHQITITSGYATQRFTNFAQPTITATAALTVTTAATMTIEGAPITAGSAVITNPYAFWIQAGRTQLDGDLGLGDARNVILATTTGTKIATGTDQKFAFWNATPIVQPANTTDLRTAIINVGLLASGGATPLNLNGGAFTAASATLASGDLTISSGNIVLTGGTSVGQLRLYEDPAGGTNYVAFKAGSLTANTTWTLPTADGLNGQALTTDGLGVLSWTTISGGGGGPFTSTGGVISYTTATDRLRLDIGDVGDNGIEVRGLASLTGNFIDVKLLTTDTQPVFAVNSAGRIRFGPGGTTAVDTTLYRSAANTLTMDHVIVSGTATSGGATALTVTPGAHTAQTAEKNDLLVNAHTNTITGAITTQRFNWFRTPTITAASALTVTTAATLAVEAAPVAAGSATITTPLALWLQSGNMQLDSGNVTLVSGNIVVTSGNMTLTSGNATLSAGRLTIADAAVSGGATALTVTPGAHTAQTAEKSDFLVNVHTNTITGAITSQRFSWLRQPTITAASALTVTTAATVAIEGEPLSSGSATITTPLALWIQSGNVKLDSGNLSLASGNITVTAGNATLTSGNLTLTSGNATLSAGRLTITDTAVAGAATALTVSPGAHTAQTAESNDFLVSAHTNTITGAITTQRFSWLRQPTITAASALTVTTAATVAIEGQPVAAGSATITTALALWVQAGNTQLESGDLKLVSGNATLSAGRLSITDAAVSGGATALTVSPGAHTAQTVEKNDFLVNAHTNTITGAITTQRFGWLRTPTITAASALTVTTAATLAIEAAPVAAGSATITNSYSFWVQGGISRFDGTINTSVQAAIQVSPYGASAGQTGEMRFLELAANGSNYVSLKAADALTANVSWTLPNADGTNGQALTTNGTGTLSWTTISGGTSPFTSTGGVIAYATATDRLRLDIGEVGDIGLEVRGIASQTANFVDVKLLTTDTEPVFAINSAGRIRFGPGGSTAVDTALYRSAANTLTTDHIVISGTATSGGATTLTISPAAHTAQTTEKNDFLVNVHTNTITGAIATQRFNWFRTPTITAASALTVTTAATLAIEAAPVAAGSATITTPLALWVQAGNAQLDSGNLTLVSGNLAITSGNATLTSGSLTLTSGNATLSAGRLTITDAAVSGGATALTVSPGAHTAQTVEKNDFLVNAHTNTITGAITTQRFSWLRTPTITAASALTVTTAATLAIEAAPVAAGSATITTPLALWIQTGNAQLDSGNLTLSAGRVTISDVAVAGGATALTISPAAHTAQTVEKTDLLVNAHTNTITGAITNQRFNWLRTPTLTAASALTVTTAATLAIEAAPVAAGSATITTPLSLWVQSGNVQFDLGNLTLASGRLTITDAAVSGGATALTITPGAHTTQTAEKNDLVVNAHTNTITGAITTQRFGWFRTPTITAASALTVTTAATLAVEAAPVAAGSATITNAYSLWVQAGTSRFDGTINTSVQAAVQVSPYGASAGQTGEMRFLELAANGSNYVAFKAADALVGNVTWTLPNADGTNGQALTTNGTGTMSWTTISGGTSPFTSTGGIIDYATSTDRLRLKIGEVGDIGLEVTGIASQTSNFIDVKLLVADTQPIFAVNSTGRIQLGAGGTTAVDTTLYRSAANTLTMDHVIISGTATTGGAATLTLSPGAHTAQTTEKNDFLVNAHTNTITGAITNQRFNWLRTPTITAASALTVTTAATLAIEAAPVATGSATITTPLALWVQSGNVKLDSGNLTLSSGNITVTSGNTTLSAGRLAITDAAVSGGATALTITPGAHTSQTVEKNDLLINAHTNTITSAITTQRFNWFRTPTITAGSALTVSQAATVAIESGPVAAGSATITNKYALWIQGGNVQLDEGSLALVRGASGNAYYLTCKSLTGDTEPFFAVDSSKQLVFGAGSATTTDTVLYRSFAHTLTTNHLVVQGVATSGTATDGVIALEIKPANHTNQSAEKSDVVVRSHTNTITGSFLTQRFSWFQKPTITATSALTVTDAATVAIEGAPIAGASASITNPYALLIQQGDVKLSSGNLTMTSGSLTMTSGSLTMTAGNATLSAGRMAITDVAVSGGATAMSISPGAHTAQTTEKNDFLMNAHTNTITGAITTQRFNWLRTPTITAGSAFTVTTAATLAIEASPLASGSATITTPLALWIQSGNVRLDSGNMTITGAAALGGATTLTISPGAHSEQTAEKNDFLINSHTNTITGNITTQRFNWFRQPTITAASALTVTNAATVSIEGPPINAGSATITSPVALWIESGNVHLKAGRLTIDDASVSGGSTVLTILPGNHTGQIVERHDLLMNAHTVTITGNITTQRFNLFNAPTVTAASTLTVTTAATLAIAGAPIAAGFASISSSHALWIQSGNVKMDSGNFTLTSGNFTLTSGAFTHSSGNMSIDGGNITINNGAYDLILADGVDVWSGTVTGTKIGKTTSQKIGFWNATPIVQPTGIVDADGTLADITTKFNSLLTKLESTGLLATA